MDIHEYQAKALLARFGIAVPPGRLAHTSEDARSAAERLGGAAWAVKAQIHAGGRGEAGGIRICRSHREVADAADQLLGQRLVTRQTSPSGKLVGRVYLEPASTVVRELYLAILVDRETETIAILASPEGGVDIEDHTAQARLSSVAVDPAIGLCGFQARQLAVAMAVPHALIPQTEELIQRAYLAFCELDATLLEINPLAITAHGDLLVLDAKMSFDDSALFRQPDVLLLHDPDQVEAPEREAEHHGLAFVGLSGDIGCIVNGAGLAMATLDMIRLAGGDAANFLDIGGAASAERVLDAFRTVLTVPGISAILVNVFAGINRCDWVAEGVVDAFKKAQVDVPVVVRLAGTHSREGRQIIAGSGLPIETADGLEQAARLVVAAAGGHRAHGHVQDELSTS